MRVKIGDLKNNLSRYIHQVTDTGEVIIVCDRDRPVACLTPLLSGSEDWRAYREKALARAVALGLEIQIPVEAPALSGFHSVRPVVAPDGRTDVSSIEGERRDF